MDKQCKDCWLDYESGIHYCPTHAAAPEMLASLRALVEYVGKASVSDVNKAADREAFYAARALISKIEGKGQANGRIIK